MKTSQDACSWTAAIETNYLVLRDGWHGGLEKIVSENIVPRRGTWAESVRNHFNEIETPVFLDRWFTSHSVLGDLLVDDEAQELQIIGCIQTKAWIAGALVLQVFVRLDSSTLDSDRVGPVRRKLVALADQFDELFAPSAVKLCQWIYIVDETLKSVTSQDAVLAWAKHNVMRSFGDLYCAFDPVTMVLQVGPEIPNDLRWYISELPGSIPPFHTMEFDAVIRYYATKYLLAKLTEGAESDMARALDSSELIETRPANIGFISVLASINPWHRDPSAQLGAVIEKINNAILEMHDRLVRLGALYAIYHMDTFWHSGFLVLARPYYVGGDLLKRERSEIGELTLSDYYRRSALATEDYYMKKLTGASERLKIQLGHLQTMSAVRNEQQTAVLNRLVVILTLVSAGLAILQLVGIFDELRNWRLLVVALVLIGAVIASIIAATYKSRGQQREPRNGR